MRAVLILLLMSSLSCTQAIKTEYIKCEVPPLPAKPTYFHAVPEKQSGGYCFSEKDFKNYIKNIMIDQKYGEDLRMILEGLK